MTFLSPFPKLSSKKLKKNVIVPVWINKIRKLSNLLFLIGWYNNKYIQIIVKEKQLIADLKKIKKGDLVKIYGIIKKKEGSKEEIEIELKKYQLINSSKELPFEIKDEISINEDTRYRYRYLDLRRLKSKELLIKKSEFLKEIRNFLGKKKFVEIGTPVLSQMSPEGANCFLVPSNLENRYYTLPQSPQIFKQLLMVGGFIKYYQIAPCFRNEDARSNRQIEFLQLDLEMSFVSARQIMKITENLLKTVLKNIFYYQQKNIHFLSLTYQEAINKYGSDKPDLRNKSNKNELNFAWITDWPLFEYDKDNQKYKIFRHPFTIPKKKFIEPLLNNKIKPEKVICEAFDLICNGEEILSGGIRIYQRELQEKVLEIIGYNKKEQEENFGYFLQALEFAAPPHGGIGLGIDRLLAVILNTNNLKELIAFPKNIDGTCSLTRTPNFFKK